MKKIKTSLVISSLFLLLPNFALAEMVQVKVSGMVCAFCAQGIKKAFGEREEVSQVEVDLDSKIVSLELKEGKSIEDKELETIIKDTGYNLVEIKREAK